MVVQSVFKFRSCKFFMSSLRMEASCADQVLALKRKAIALKREVSVSMVHWMELLMDGFVCWCVVF